MADEEQMIESKVGGAAVRVNFDPVPGINCPNPAMFAIGGYIPKNGHPHGILDRIVYACGEHFTAAQSPEWMGDRAKYYTAGSPPASPTACGQRTISSMDEEQIIDAIEQVIEAYLKDLDDPGEVDSRDLAENIALQLEKGNR